MPTNQLLYPHIANGPLHMFIVIALRDYMYENSTACKSTGSVNLRTLHTNGFLRHLEVKVEWVRVCAELP